MDDSLSHAVWLSAELAAWTLVLHLLTGVVFAALLLHQRWWASVLDGLVMLPLIFPPIVLGFALLFVLGRQGWIGSSLATVGIELVFSFHGLLLAAWLAGLPLMVKSIEGLCNIFSVNSQNFVPIINRSFSNKSFPSTTPHLALPVMLIPVSGRILSWEKYSLLACDA